MKMYLMLLTLLAVLVIPAIAGIPAVLPDPDTTPPDTTLPVKVFILSGQSNMLGYGNVGPLGTLGTLETITKTEGLFPNMLDASNNWTVRNDVWCESTVTFPGATIGNTGQEWLTIGLGNGSNVGVELQFGHIMGYYFDEPVILIKTANGNRGLGWDFLPPGSERFTYGGYTYAGFGDEDKKWSDSDPYDPDSEGSWYAGKQYDDCVTAAKTILDNFDTKFPDYAAQGYEIAGFAWWQGNWEMNSGEPYAGRYEVNMANLVKAFRADFNAPDAPFVLATFAEKGWALDGHALTVANAQLAVSGETGNYPEFEGNVKTIEARGYWRDSSVSPSTTGYHYNHNAETFMLVGDAMGRAMAEMQRAFDVDAGENMVIWSDEIVTLDATVEEGVSVVSYSWTAIPSDGVVFSNPTSEDTTVTITKDAGDMAAVMVRLTVDNGVDDPVTDSVRIEVYDNACLATRDGLGIINEYDLSGNCIVDIGDVVIMASKWLEDNSLTDPVIKTNY